VYCRKRRTLNQSGKFKQFDERHEYAMLSRALLFMAERLLGGFKNRLLQILARSSPGATTWRVRLHRWRGVQIGQNVWIGYDAVIETSRPDLVIIRDRATLQIRATIIAHFREQSSGVVIEEDATIGPGAIVLPNVTIGRGAIVTAGSVVTKSVPPKTMVRGNPAEPIATVDIPLRHDVSLKEFAKGLRPIRRESREPGPP
jgi:serine acetyltransferase